MVWPDHLLGLADWAALPEDTSRNYELVDGVLVVSPKSPPRHQRAVWRLAANLDPQLPWVVLTGTEVVIDPAEPSTVRVPDLIAVRESAYRPYEARCAGADVELAVEILSDGSRRTDRVAKFAEYAEIGIPYYWLIDLDSPATLTAYHLVDDHYELVADSSTTTTLDLAGTRVEIDLAALTSARA
ncbi:Uma2 family endonuclease [Nocardia cyriacigeorgica]|uniref:Uma2 family endonuclease n=1 Tax=Nocardia cyriacigeorgica TaxID=135487 RepID=A0A5R8PGZ3_9NOCA|nr:Uma2 family endonuclease [Nocardia cyriacigeorgica]